jgi:hypothetical protein
MTPLRRLELTSAPATSRRCQPVWRLAVACVVVGAAPAGCGGGSGSGSASTISTACPAAGLTTSDMSVSLSADCSIAGDVNLSGSATLSMTGGTLSIAGNLTLDDHAAVSVSNGGLIFPQTNYNQYSITMNDQSQLTLSGATLITNQTQQNNFSMLLQANDDSLVTVDNSSLNTNTGSWLLAHFGDQSRLSMSGSQNLPTEIYPGGTSTISITSGSSLGSVWLDFAGGVSATVDIPSEDADGNYNFSLGSAGGVAYTVNITASSSRLGVNSHPNSSVIVNGHGTSGASDAEVVLAYYVANSTAPVSIDGLDVGGDVSRQFTDQGRNLQLNHVNLNPYSWQVYVSASNNFPVTVTNSKINEIGALTDGIVNISGSVLQLGSLGAFGPGSMMTVSGSQIWSQDIQAENGGQLTIADSQLHGNFISAAGTGSFITMNNVGEERNGVAPQSCAPVDGFPPNSGGVPLCNPYNPLYQCSQVVSSGGAVITSSPALSCPP